MPGLADSAGGRQTLLILGASGDLTARLLLPGLGSLLASGLARNLVLIGSGSDGWGQQRWHDQVTASFAEAGASGAAIDDVLASTRYIASDVTKAEDMKSLLDACEGPPILYFALPPAIAVRSCEALTGIDLPKATRLVLEKPFGTGGDSAAALNELLLKLVDEHQIHRVDHFLGFSTVLNIIGLRFANRVLGPVLTSEHVESVDIIWDEDLGLESRARYYDGAGAMVDMIQSHLLQVLALLTMEAPASMTARDFRDDTSQILRATRLWDDDPVESSRRARYTAGNCGGRDLPAYADEEGIDPSRETETLAEIVVGIESWRWQGVPFRLRSGKALGSPRKEAVFNFHPSPHVPKGLIGVDRPDRLRIGLGFGADRLRLDMNVTGPGDPMGIDPVTLEAGFGKGDLPEYGEVLKGVLDDDPTLSVRGDTAVDCWRIIEPVDNAWRNGEVPLEEYAAGSKGPLGWASSDFPSE